MSTADEKPKALILVGGSVEDQEELCRTVLQSEFEGIPFTAAGEAAAREKFASCLRGRAECVLKGDFRNPEFRRQFIADARAAGFRVVAFDLDYERLLEERRAALRTATSFSEARRIPKRPEGEAPSLEEGFDEINYVKRVEGGLRFRLVEERMPMCEFRKDENGNTIVVELGPDHYIIDRPGSIGCLMNIETLKQLNEDKETMR